MKNLNIQEQTPELTKSLLDYFGSHKELTPDFQQVDFEILQVSIFLSHN